MEAVSESALSKEDLQELLKGKFGHDTSIVDFVCKSGSQAGDNFGSTLLSVDVKILNNNSSENHHIIAKLLPPTEFLREVFNVSVTFPKEINLYKLVNPELIEIQKEIGMQENEIVNMVPTFYGSRISHGNPENESTDFDAVLLLGNLKAQGFTLANRMKGLNLQHCKLVIRSLATFNALCVALREKKLDTFKETVLKATMPFHVGPKFVDEEQMRAVFAETLGKNVPECRSYVERIKKCIVSHLSLTNVSLGKEPFATLVHNDLWTNNILFKYEGSDYEAPVDIKILDFQTTLYSSPAHDILFFLFSSAQRQVVENYYDYLISLYYNSFISQLKKLNCNVQAFSKSALLEELDTIAPIELFHILFMLGVIYAEKSETTELSEVKSVDSMGEVGSNKVTKKKVIDLINDFDKRGWLREKV